MELDERTLDTIGLYVRRNLRDWMREAGSELTLERLDLALTERIVRVEEELKAQRELMKQGFEQVDKRFEQVDKRFEQMDKRFEQMEKRFEQAERRFEVLETRSLETLRAMQRFVYWSFGFIASATALIIASIRFL